MNQLQIDCFMAVFKHKSISAAAEELFFTTQAISQNINNLESELGIRLFSRSKSGVMPTNSGMIFFRFASELESKYQTTLNNIRELYDSMTASFSIGLSDYIDPLGAISSGISAFTEEHPLTHFSGVQYNNKIILEKLMSGEIDVAIACDSQIATNGDYEIEPVSAEELRLYIANYPDITDMRDLDMNNLNHIASNIAHVDTPYGIWTDEEWNEISKRMSSYLNLSLKNRYVMPNIISVVECARSVKCAAVCDIKYGYLHNDDTIPSVPINSNTNICCIWHKSNENPLIPEFCGYLKKYFAE